MPPGNDASHPGIRFRHNSDLDPGEDYLAGFPRTRDALSDTALLEAFGRAEQLANAGQWQFRLFGRLSLAFGTIALVLLTWKLFLTAVHVHVSNSMLWATEVLAVVSVVLALGPRFTKSRAGWLNARFLTEQMRQWHFQSLLDGHFVSLASTDPEAFAREREDRWARFQQRAHAHEGARETFTDAEVYESWHTARPYPKGDPTILAEVFRAYADLRFDWQKSYFKLKREVFARRDEWTEGLARWALFTAVVLAAGKISLLVAPALHAYVSEGTALAVSAFAVTLAIVSAALRVYRSAEGLSAQRELYESKWIRLITLEQSFRSARSSAEKLRVMRDVEVVEVEELREFLRICRRSSYVL